MLGQTLVVVRHGQTDWNSQLRYQGSADIALNARGIQQSEKVREELRQFDFDAVYSSPLARAMETVRVIIGDRTIVKDPRLAEIRLGEWQGLTVSEVAERWPDTWREWREDPNRVTPEGGETLTELRERVSAFLEDLNGKTILCVSHGMVIRMIDAIIKGQSPADWHSVVPNGHASIYSLDA